MVTQLAEVPETVSQDRIQQRTVEQIVDAPVQQAVEELAEVSKVFSQDRIQQRAVEQTIENPATSLAEMIVEAPVVQTQGRTQQGVTTHFQHVVNTIEVEKPKIIKETAQRKKPITQEKINQATKHVEVPEVPLSQFTDKVIDKPVVAQRQIPMVQAVQKTMEIPQLQYVDETTDDPAVQVPRAQVVEKTVGIPQFQIVEKTVEAPQLQSGTQTSESLVHLTGAMKPDDPDAKIKFFAEEALHGVGGFIFDAHGNRVANGLGKRDCVRGEMWENKLPFSLALNNAVSDDTVWQCKQYTGRGLRKLHESGTAPAEGMEALVSKTPDSMEAHYQASLKTARNPNGEPYPAFTSDKSWNEASGKTGSEKKFYHKTPVVQQRQVPTVQTVQKTMENPQAQFLDEVVGMPVVVQRKVPMIQRVQKTVEVPQIQYVDKIVEAPVAAAQQPVPVDAESFLRVEEVSVGTQTVSRKRRLSTETESADGEHGLVQGRESRREMDETRERHAAGEDLDLLPVAPNMEAGGSHLQATTGEERIEIWTQDLSTW